VRTRIPQRVLGIAALLALLAATGACRVDDYVIAKDTPEGWVIVQLSNAECPPIEGHWHREFLIPASGYLCTATAPTGGYVRERYWIGGSSDERSRLTIGERVHSRSTAELKGGDCQVLASVFWYGSRQHMTGDISTAIRQKVPSCAQPERAKSPRSTTFLREGTPASSMGP